MTSPSKSYQAFEKSTHVSTPTLTLTKRKQHKTKPTFTFTRDTWKTLIGTWLALYICASATILGLNASSPTTSGWWLCGTYLLNTSLLLVSCRVTEGLVTVLRTKALPKNPSNLLIMFMGSSLTMNICNVALFAVIFTPSSHFPTAESFFLLLLQILSTITLFVHLMVIKNFVVNDVTRNEGALILSFARCSCCRQISKKAAFCLPSFTGLVVSAAFLAKSSALDDDSCKDLNLFLVSATACFACYFIVAFSIVLDGRKRFDKLKLGLLALTILSSAVCVAVGFRSFFYLSASCENGSVGYHGAIVAKALLTTYTLCAAFLTFCCKIESCLWKDLPQQQQQQQQQQQPLDQDLENFRTESYQKQ